MDGPYDQQQYFPEQANVTVSAVNPQQVLVPGSQQRNRRSGSSSSSSRSSSPRGYKHGGQVGAGFHAVHDSRHRRQPRYHREVIRLPDQQGLVRQVHHRLPTPEPDVVERVYVQRAAQEVVEEITEIPMTPPPRIQERNIVEPAGPPKVIRRSIRVPPRSGGYASYHHQDAPLTIGGSHGYSTYGGSYGAVQQGVSYYQPPLVSPPPSIISPSFAPTNLGLYGGGFQQPSFGFGAALPQQTSFGYGGGFSVPPVQPPLSGASLRCFYV